MIIAYVGLDGSGKTYHMAEVAQRLIKSGRDVFSTSPFKGARLLENHRQLIRLERADIFFDEWHQDLDAREWYHLDPVIKHIVTQHRKYKLVIHWSAQAWAYMDPYVRRQTTFVWNHEAMFRDENTGKSRIVGKFPFIGQVHGLHRRWKHPAWEYEAKHKNPEVLSKSFFLIKESIYETYDSYKKIALTARQVSDDEILTIRDPYAAEIIKDPRAVAAKMTAKRPIPNELLAAPTSSDPVENSNPNLVPQQGRFDDNEQAQDRIELREREENTDDGSPRFEISHPIEQASR